MGKSILIIDFNNCLFASYYGKPLINHNGINVNAVKGFFMKLKNLRDIFNPDYIVIARDMARTKTFRRELYPEYKAQRKPSNPDVVNQMQITQQLLALLGFPVLCHERYEADDIIGMISQYGEDHGMESIIVSSDRDMYQLVGDHTYVISPRSGDLIDPTYMQEHYHLNAQQWIELKILQGDRSDNIPGIPGIGEVTALSLMQTYGSIASIYQHLDELKPGVKHALEIHRDLIDPTRTLVTIVRDYSVIDLQEASLHRGELFADEVLDQLIEYQLYSLIPIMRYDLFQVEKHSVEVQTYGTGESGSSQSQQAGDGDQRPADETWAS